jgi:predicted DCC family thiol-disulfide oxidoreductase YuxK
MPADRIKMLYDGLCPLCKREVRVIGRHDKHGMIEPVDIAAPGFDAEGLGLTRSTVHARMHAILPDGSVVTGMEAFRRIYDAIGMGWLWRWTGWPILRPIFDVLYAGFAKVRPRLQRFGGGCETDACAVESDPQP